MGGRWWVVGAVMVVVVGAAVLLGACSSDDSTGSPDQSSREKVVVEAYGIATSSPVDLERAATIVQQRLRALDVRDASVKVNGQTLVATGTGVGEAAAKVLQPGFLEFRPVLRYVEPAHPGPGSVDEYGSDVVPGRAGVNGALRYQLGSTAFTGAMVTAAEAQNVGGPEGWIVNLALDPAGSDALNRLAGDLYPKQPPENSVAIVLDGVVQSAPAFQQPEYENGEVQISGSLTKVEAMDLAAVLGFGSLPVPLRLAV
jgi:preprotein translocase subunit SecD